MARFDVYRNPLGDGYLLDCQADLLDHLATRFVIPLLPVESTPRPFARLTPLLSIEGEQFILAAQLSSAVPKSVLKTPVIASLADQDMAILGAIDMLISGY